MSVTEEESGVADPELKAHRELAAGTRAFDAGDLAHAAMHASNAVVAAPSLPEAHQLLARLADHPQGGRDLFPLNDPLALATLVARGHVVAQEGDFGYALGLLGKAQAHVPETAWADVPWVIAAATAAAVPPEAVTNLALDLLEVVREHPEPGNLRPAMTPYLQLIGNTIAVHPDEGGLLGAAAYLFRRFDIATAADYAVRADELTPSHASAVGLGLILRDLGHIDEALRAWVRALGYQPDNLAVYADIGEMLLKAGRLDEAFAYGQRALAIDPAHICSRITVLEIQFRQTRDPAHLEALLAIFEAQQSGNHAWGHAQRALLAATGTASGNLVVGGSRSVLVHGSKRHLLAQTKGFIKARSKQANGTNTTPPS